MKLSLPLRPLAFALALVAPLAVSANDEPEAEDRSMLEGYNQTMHKFNDKVDGWILKPVTKGYKAIAPEPVEMGVSNFFSNLKEIINIPNDLLQGKFKQAANDTGRLLVNSTLGIAGLFDVADDMGMKKQEGEDLGQTLAVWGVPSGPYVVIPVLGPSTLRDFPASLTENFALNPVRQIDSTSLKYSLYGLAAIDTRAGLLDAEELISGDRYTFFKQAYLQRREYLINDGEVEDDFGADSDEYGDDDY